MKIKDEIKEGMIYSIIGGLLFLGMCTLILYIVNVYILFPNRTEYTLQYGEKLLSIQIGFLNSIIPTLIVMIIIFIIIINYRR